LNNNFLATRLGEFAKRRIFEFAKLRQGEIKLQPQINLWESLGRVYPSKVMSIPICPYCNSRSELMCSSKVYQSDNPESVYACLPCDAWIEIDKNNTRAITPLGRLANAELRAAKSQAHNVFDLLWQSELLSRSAAYEWLVSAMDSHRRDCHFAMFDVAQCQTATALSRAKLEELQTQVIISELK
jgi:zinc-finger-containing domain